MFVQFGWLDGTAIRLKSSANTQGIGKSLILLLLLHANWRVHSLCCRRTRRQAAGRVLELWRRGNLNQCRLIFVSVSELGNRVRYVFIGSTRGQAAKMRCLTAELRGV